MEHSPFNQGLEPDSLQRGWAHTLTFIGIILALVVIIGVGVFAWNGMKQQKTGEVTKEPDSGISEQIDTPNVQEVSDESTTEETDTAEQGDSSSENSWWSGQTVNGKKIGVSKAGMTTGKKGATQVFDVLSSIAPSTGASFDISTFALKLVSNPVPGSKLSADRKTVTAPGEGTYVAQSNGVIKYTPTNNFTGQARGVGFTVQDTRGVTFSNVYSPVVKAPTSPTTPPIVPPVTCADPSITSTRMLDRRVNLDYYDYYGPAGVRTIKLRNISNGDALPLYISSDQSKQLVMPSSGGLWYSGNGGEDWQNRTPDGITVLNQENVLVSEDGSRIVVFSNDPDQSNGRLYGFQSQNGGVTWNRTYLPQGVRYTRGYTMSPDGNVVSFMGAKDVGNDEYVYSNYVSSDNAVTWDQRFEFTTEDSIQGMTMHANGQIMVVSNAYGENYDSQTLISYDQGETFQQFSIPITPEYGGYYDFQASRDGQTRTVQVGYSDGVAVSNNGGVDWQTLNTSTLATVVRVFVASNNGTIIIHGYENGGQRATLITTNGGGSWQNFDTPDIDTSFPQEMRFYETAGQYLLRMQNLDTYENRWYTSTNAGSSWSRVQLTVNQAYEARLIDLDPQTPGNQYLINREQERGWKAEYVPSADELTVTITDMDKFYDQDDENANYFTEFEYTLTSPGCASPTPGTILAILDFGG